MAIEPEKYDGPIAEVFEFLGAQVARMSRDDLEGINAED